MRIVAGAWRGRPLTAPKGHDTRPTSDRVREAVFGSLSSRLGPDLGGAVVLDAFAGTGALGLEALSRGASSAVLVENDPAALNALRANVSSLGAASLTQVRAVDVLTAVRRDALPGAPFSLVMLDPPYRMEPSRIGEMLADLAEHGGLVDDAVVVYEHATGTTPVWPAGFEALPARRYGSTAVTVALFHRGAADS
jgi:16S rRNA (guanine966-N2)-methyltransferase